MNSYNAWCVEAEYDLKAELQNLYSNDVDSYGSNKGI